MLFSAMVRALLGGLVAVFAVLAVPHAQQAAAAESRGAEKYRATLDQYCVTCHNDRLKTSNLSLEKLDLATLGEHPDLWERVVRKLRAGVMPPPDVRRPALADYEALRDFLEAELD